MTTQLNANEMVKVAGKPQVYVNFGHKGGISKSTSTFFEAVILGSKSYDVLKEEKLVKQIEFEKEELELLEDEKEKVKKASRIKRLEAKHKKMVFDHKNENKERREVAKNVLVIDLDFQANVSRALLDKLDYEEVKARGAVFEAIKQSDITDFVKKSKISDTIHVLAASRSNSNFETYLVEQKLEGKKDMSKALNDAIKNYVKENNIEVILIDVSPSLNLLGLQALSIDLDGEIEANHVIVPAQLDGNTQYSLMDVIETVENSKQINKYLQLNKFVPVLAERVNNDDEEILNGIRKALGSLVSENVIIKRQVIKRVFIEGKGYNENLKSNRESYKMYYELCKELGML